MPLANLKIDSVCMYTCNLFSIASYKHVFTNYFIKFIQFSCRESLMKDLESSLQQKKDDITRFEEERTDLIAKVQFYYHKIVINN